MPTYTRRSPGQFPEFPPPPPAWPNMAARQTAYLMPFPVAITTEPVTSVVTVPSSGTPVPLANAPTPCCRISIEVTSANTGVTFVGVPGMNHANGVNVIAVLAAYTSAPGTTLGQWAAWCGADEQLDLSDYVIDAAMSGQGLSVTYWPR